MSVPARTGATPNTLVGQAVERTEDLRFLTGRGTFADDYEPAGVLHAVILRSSVPHGHLRSIDARPALTMPGVKGVITAEDIGPAIPTIPLRLAPIAGLEKYLQPVIAHGKVRYAGEPLAVVVADSRAIAEDALEAISVEIEALDPVADWRASEADRCLLFEENATNVATRYSAQIGDADAAIAAADYVRRETFRAHRHTANPMETRGAIAEWNVADGRLIVTAATKVTFFNRRLLAKMMGLEESAIDLIEIDVGGGFGVRGEFYPEDFLIPFAARHLQRPVKWIEDRREHLLAANHSREIDCDLEIACKSDGTIVAVRGKIYGDMGAYVRTNGGVVPAKAAQFLHGPYRVPNIKVDVAAFMTSKTPVGTYRAPGRFEANFFRERLMDMAARDLNIDPVAFRRKNLITEAELPYSIGQLVPYETPTAYDSGDYHACLDRLLEEFDWDKKAALQGKAVDGRYQGLAATCFVESGGAGPRENCKFILERDGGITINVGSSALGQGLETVFAQIAADAMGLPFDAFTIRHGSTTLVHEGFGTYHSRALVMGGSAILDGAKNMVAAIRAAGAAQLGCAPDDAVWHDGHIAVNSGRRLGLGEIAGGAPDGTPLSADGTFANTKRTYSYGAHAAHVAVDARTGHVQVIDYLAIEDVGRAVNPGIVHGQAIGAAVQGLGGVFFDHLIYDADAQLLNASLVDYLLPLATDFPSVRGVTLELRPSPSNPLGAKGAGEGGIVAVAATIGNAVAAALVSLGVEPKELPLTPPRIWRLVQEAKARLSASKS
ncbi:MAG TPA: xanthine dehydrogenase family protein molybdopterin-binding subunit [Pseudolabrys sp.]|jgi:carbon-monoxide dehydrogenase large subunit|nr:xanthine dehydrogenase family protein molybdopterin-binding subunit [Pseudolabrys sp.]